MPKPYSFSGQNEPGNSSFGYPYPIVWLGQSVNTSPICSGYSELSAVPILTSLGCAIRRPSLKKTHLNSQLRARLGAKGPLMVDSGGFALMTNPQANWNLRHVIKAIDGIDADIFVSLDHPPAEGDSPSDRRRKIIRSHHKFETLSARFPHKIIMPVIHGRNVSDVEFAINLLKTSHDSLQWIGFGGIVPLLRNRRVSPEISSMGTEVFIARALQIIRDSHPRSTIHVFGAGGTQTFPAVFAFGADSADSIGWRQAAGYGSIFLPLKSQRAIRWNRQKRLPRKKLDGSDFAEIAECECPICRTKMSLAERTSALRKHFHNRSIHNAWIISNQTKFWSKSRLEMHSFVASGGLGMRWAKAAEIVRSSPVGS